MATMRTRQTSAEWSAGIVPPVTAKDAVAKLQSAIDYADDAVNEVLSTLGGTVPPPRSLMPDLYKARDKVVNAREAIKALADRTPEAHVNPLHVTTGQRLGAELIDAANEALTRAKTPDSAAKMVSTAVQVAERAASTAARGILQIGGKMLTPMEVLLGGLLLDEILNGGRLRRRILKGG